MEFRILGPLEVSSGGRQLALGGAKQRAVLAILLLHRNEVVSTERLIDELWDDRPPATAAKTVQVYVSQLRKALRGRGEDETETVLVTKAPGYMLVAKADEVDADRFQRLVEDGRRALAAGNPGEAARTLLDGLALWRGPALADFALDTFARSETARLDEARVAAIEERIEADLALGRHAELVGELESLVAAHPLRERLRGQLMLALYRSERQAEALDAYRDARRTLVDQLGLEPGPALQQLERAILAQDATLAPPPPAESEREADNDEGATGQLPSGTVTLLFTDIEGSTQLQRLLAERYHEVVAEHWRLLEEAFAEHRGLVVDRQTESFFVVFRRASQATLAAAAAQSSLARHRWPDGAQVKVRMGIHSGDPEVARDRYVGLAVSRAARICEAAHGGQVLMSSATRSLLADDGRVTLRSLGSHRLKDFDEPEPISQLVVDGLPSRFPPLRIDARSSRRKRLLLASAAVLLVGAIAVTAVLATGGNPSPLRSVAVNSLARIDASTGRLKGSIPVGVRPVAVAVGEGSLWVTNFDEQTVSRVDPKTMKELTRVPAGGAPTGIAVGAGSVWVTHGFDGTISQIDPGVNRIVATARVASSVGDVAIVRNAVWVLNKNDGAVLRIDPSTGAPVRKIVVGGSPTSLASDAQSLWIADGRTVVRVDAGSNRIAARIALRYVATNIAVGGGAVWVSANLANVVMRINPATDSTSVEIPVEEGPSGLAADGSAVWVANTLAGDVSRIDPASNRVVETMPVGLQPGAVALADGSVWVTVAAA